MLSTALFWSWIIEYGCPRSQVPFCTSYIAQLNLSVATGFIKKDIFVLCVFRVSWLFSIVFRNCAISKLSFGCRSLSRWCSRGPEHLTAAPPVLHRWPFKNQVHNIRMPPCGQQSYGRVGQAERLAPSFLWLQMARYWRVSIKTNWWSVGWGKLLGSTWTLQLTYEAGRVGLFPFVITLLLVSQTTQPNRNWLLACRMVPDCFWRKPAIHSVLELLAVDHRYCDAKVKFDTVSGPLKAQEMCTKYILGSFKIDLGTGVSIQAKTISSPFLTCYWEGITCLQEISS